MGRGVRCAGHRHDDGLGIKRIAAKLGVGVGTVQRVAAGARHEAETREDTTVRQKEVGRSALRDVQRAALYHRRALEAKVLGFSIPADFIERASASLVGQAANSPEELATIAQVLRDPRFETFRVFYTQEGRIVGHTSLTSRLPGAERLSRYRGRYWTSSSPPGRSCRKSTTASTRRDLTWFPCPRKRDLNRYTNTYIIRP